MERVLPAKGVFLRVVCLHNCAAFAPQFQSKKHAPVVVCPDVIQQQDLSADAPKLSANLVCRAQSQCSNGQGWINGAATREKTAARDE